MGLCESFSNVRDQIMLIDPLLPIDKVFSYIQQKEFHRLFTSPTPPTESIALAGHKTFPTPSFNPNEVIVPIAKS